MSKFKKWWGRFCFKWSLFWKVFNNIRKNRKNLGKKEKGDIEIPDIGKFYSDLDDIQNKIYGIDNYEDEEYGEPEKPDTVPEKAVWNSDEYEWEIGEKNGKGEEIGEWKWWAAPDGYLCCHTFFDKKGNIISAKRYHPNGELAWDVYKNDQGHEESIYYASTEETTEYFPENALKNVYKAQRIPGKFPVTFEFFDKEGNQIKIGGKEIESLKKGKEDETAIEAVERLKKFTEILKKDKYIDEDFLGDLGEYGRLYVDKKVSQKEIEAQEKKFGIILPDSYKDYVLRYGLTTIGEDRSMFLPIKQFSKALTEEWCWDTEEELKKDFGETGVEKFSNMYAFTYGDAGLQIESFHLFDYNKQDPNTGDIPVMDFDQDVPGDLLGEYIDHKNFDAYISWTIDKEIEELLEDLETN